MILTPDDFKTTPYIIPNDVESPDLQDYIDKREAFYLKSILGSTLYKDFIDGLEASEPIEQIWLDLKYGTNSELTPPTDGSYDDGKYEWLGMADMLAPAIWHDWVTDNYNTYTNSGMVRPTAQNNSVGVNPDHDLVRAWNDFVNKLSGYPHNRRNNLYGFLKYHTDEYGAWTFTCRYRYKNVLDI